MLTCGGGLKGFRYKEIGYCTRKTRYITIQKIIVIDTLQKRMTAIQINHLDMGKHVISDLDAQEWFFVGFGKQTVNHGVYFHAKISVAISGHSASIFDRPMINPEWYAIPGSYETPPFVGPDMCAIIPQAPWVSSGCLIWTMGLVSWSSTVPVEGCVTSKHKNTLWEFSRTS